MPLQNICVIACLFLTQVTADTGVHFVMERHPDSYFCGHLQCVADLTNSDHSVSSLAEMTIYDITRVNSELKLASVSAFHPDLYVDTTKSSAMSCSGIISRLQANLTLQLRHDIDCLYGVYKCQLELFSESGHPEVLTEIVVPENNHSYSRVAEIIRHIDTLTGLFNIHTTQVSNQTVKINKLESQLDDLTTQMMDQTAKINTLGSQLNYLTTQLINQTVKINNQGNSEDHQTTKQTVQQDSLNKESQLDDLTTKLADQTALLHNLSQILDLEQTKQTQMQTDLQPSTPTTHVIQEQVPCYRGMPSTDDNRTIINLWNKTLALCDTQTDGGGWVVIQRRTKGDVDFYQSWNSYKNGFGDPNTEYWIGNDDIHNLTSQGFNEFRIEFEQDGKQYFGQWANFSVADEQSNYIMTVGEMSGTIIHDHLQKNNGSSFMDPYTMSELKCDWIFDAGWWFTPEYCQVIRNGILDQEDLNSVFWSLYSSGVSNTEMKVRRP